LDWGLAMISAAVELLCRPFCSEAGCGVEVKNVILTSRR
jgi:hypothetical protein